MTTDRQKRLECLFELIESFRVEFKDGKFVLEKRIPSQEENIVAPLSADIALPMHYLQYEIRRYT